MNTPKIPTGKSRRIAIAIVAVAGLGLLMWWLLRRWPQHMMRLGLVYECACLMEYTSALLYVPNDEFRVFWYFVNIPGVYIILGPR